MKGNSQLQQDVQDAIKWQPLLNAAEIGVTAKDGVVSLTGVVDSYAKKTEAEDAAKNVGGVTALVETMEVRYPSSYSKTNAEIATEVLNALKTRWEVPSDKVKVKVEAGWVTHPRSVNYMAEPQKPISYQLVMASCAAVFRVFRAGGADGRLSTARHCPENPARNATRQKSASAVRGARHCPFANSRPRFSCF